MTIKELIEDEEYRNAAAYEIYDYRRSGSRLVADNVRFLKADYATSDEDECELLDDYELRAEDSYELMDRASYEATVGSEEPADVLDDTFSDENARVLIIILHHGWAEDAKRKIKYSSQNKYDRQNARKVSLKLNRNTDKDILEWLDTQSNQQGAIKTALRMVINDKK